MPPDSQKLLEDTELAELCQSHCDSLVAIQRELEPQRQKWGKDKPQSLPGFVLILEGELAEAKLGWLKNEGRNSPLAEVVQIAAVALECLARYGTKGNAWSTNDATEVEMREVRRKASLIRWGAE